MPVDEFSLLLCSGFGYPMGFGSPSGSGVGADLRPKQGLGRVWVSLLGFRCGSPDAPPTPNPTCCHPYSAHACFDPLVVACPQVLLKIRMNASGNLNHLAFPTLVIMPVTRLGDRTGHGRQLLASSLPSSGRDLKPNMFYLTNTW
jgi:hypothetical protein